MDEDTPIEESVGAMAELVREGKVRHIGISNVTLDELERSRRTVPIASVQNRYSLADCRHGPSWPSADAHRRRQARQACRLPARLAGLAILAQFAQPQMR